MGVSIGRTAFALCLGSQSAVAPALAFEGRYVAGGAGYEQSLTVSKAGKSHRGKASVATRGCVGEFEGAGQADGKHLVLLGKLDNRECRLTLSLTGPWDLTVDEDGCLTFHGTACEFAGSYKRQAQ